MSDVDDIFKLDVDQIIQKLQTERVERARNLEQTRRLYDLWRDCLEYSAPKVLLDHVNALLVESSQVEWGPDTGVTFDFDAKTVIIENFDGRIEILRGEKDNGN
jgi:hypothetical protein